MTAADSPTNPYPYLRIILPDFSSDASGATINISPIAIRFNYKRAVQYDDGNNSGVGTPKVQFQCFGYAQKYHALSAFGGGGFLIALVQLLKQSSQKPQGKMSWSGDATNNIIACFFRIVVPMPQQQQLSSIPLRSVSPLSSNHSFT